MAYRSAGAGLTASYPVGTLLECRLRHYSGLAAAQNVRLVFGPYYLAAGVHTWLPNAFRLRAAIETLAGQVYPVTFGGQLVKDVAAGAQPMITSDPVMDFASDATYYVRVSIELPSGGSGLYTHRRQVALDEQAVSRTSGSQVYASGPMTGGTDIQLGWTPIAVVGVPMAPQHSCLIFGDSLIATGDSFGDGKGNFGWVYRALSDAKIPASNTASSGAFAFYASPADQPLQFELCKYATHVMLSFGRNDIGNVTWDQATVQNSIDTVIAACNARGCKVYAALVPPHTTSTDVWATEAGQSGFGARNKAGGMRDLVNAHYAAKVMDGSPSQLHGVVDHLSQLSPVGNHVVWRGQETDGAATSNDGIHFGSIPGVDVHARPKLAMAASIATWT